MDASQLSRAESMLGPTCLSSRRLHASYRQVPGPKLKGGESRTICSISQRQNAFCCHHMTSTCSSSLGSTRQRCRGEAFREQGCIMVWDFGNMLYVQHVELVLFEIIFLVQHWLTTTTGKGRTAAQLEHAKSGRSASNTKSNPSLQGFSRQTCTGSIVWHESM